MRKSLSFGLASAFLWFLSSLAPSYAEQVLSQQAADQTASAGLIINVIYDRSVAKAPRGFTAAIAQVVDYFEAHFANPITITINVGYGMIAGGALPADALGASEAVVERVPYATLVSALEAAETPGASTLPTTDPTGGTYWLPTAEARALGLDRSDPELDGDVGFGDTPGLFDFDKRDGVTPGRYDFFGVVAHEFSEIMGRMLFADGKIEGTPNSYDVLDLLHFSGAGKRIFTEATGYFSIDNGATKIESFNTTAGGDSGDWAGDTPDAFNAFGARGVLEPISETDLTELNALGWALAATPPAPPSPAQ